MKFEIFDAEENKSTVHLIPMFILKSRSVARLCKIEEYYPFLRSGYYALRDYVKENGHFDLVEIDCNDGDKIKMRI